MNYSSKWDVPVTYLPSELREPCSGGGGKSIRARAHGGHRESKALWKNTSKARMNSRTLKQRGRKKHAQGRFWSMPAPLHISYSFQFRVFMKFFSVWTSASLMSVIFLLFVCLAQFLYGSLFYFCYLEACSLLMIDRQGVNPDRRWGGTGRSVRKDYHSRDILCEGKSLFSKQRKKEQLNKTNALILKN